MTQFVLDASALAPFFLADERGELNEEILRRQRAGEEIIAPALFPYEIINVLLNAMKRGRISEPQVLEELRELATWSITLDERVGHLGEIFDLAIKHDLTAYDASYLELAIDGGHALATGDAALARAAIVESVELVTT